MAMILTELSLGSIAKLASFVFWGALYIGHAVDTPGKTPEWSSRVITLIHSIACSVIGLCQCSLKNPQRFTAAVTPAQYALMAWSWGYFVFDLYWCMVFGNESPLVLVHHAISIVAITKYMNKPNTGCTFACAIVLLEITNPLLQTRWFLRKQGHDKTLLFSIVEITFLAFFLFIRGFVGTWLIVKIINSKNFDRESKSIAVILYAVSLLFIAEILRYAHRKYRNKVLGLTSRLWQKSSIVPYEASLNA